GNHPLCAGFAMMVVLGLATAFAPVVIAHDPYAINFADALQPPGIAHVFGTDNLGRDILARILVAARIDLEIASICVALPFLVGSLIGAFAGYVGGRIDAAIMRLVDILWAFPFYVLVIAIIGSLGPGLANMYLAFTLVVWISFARIVRGEVLV